MPRISDYRSKALTRSQVENAIAANEHAKKMGTALNLSLDIHWAWTRFAIADRRTAVAELLESQRHWTANHGVHAFLSILVREAPPSSQEGEHAHQLIYVPHLIQTAFIDHTKDFLRKNRRHQGRALKANNIYSDGKLAYLLKGSTSAARPLVETLNKSPRERQGFADAIRCKSSQGVIGGKRLSISHALCRRARQAAMLRVDAASEIYAVGRSVGLFGKSRTPTALDTSAIICPLQQCLSLAAPA